MTWLWLAAASLLLALVPAVMFAVNLLYHLTPKASTPESRPSISVIIPARNEQNNIAAAVESVLNNQDVDLEVLVLDDHSEDSTAQIVSGLVRAHPRVRLEHAPELPPGWNGKHHACAAFWKRAVHPLLVFMDADVRLAPTALRRIAWFLEGQGADLVSGFPRQVTRTLGEQLVIPLMYFILLGFLPIWWMRRSSHPIFATGCGQFFMIRRDAYAKVGGHAAIKASRADGLTLPCAFRQAGLVTDIFDGTDLMSCRMYGNFAQVWGGLEKNATEGLGSPGRIVPFTMLLVGGHILPFVALPLALHAGAGHLAIGLLAAAVLLDHATRLVAARRFRQSVLGALLHPVGVAVLLAVQWHALFRLLAGKSTTWKGRSYPPEDNERDRPSP